MKVKEILELEKGNFDFAEVYQYREPKSHTFHTDSIDFKTSNDESDCSDPPFDKYLDVEIKRYYIMDDEDYARSILANTTISDDEFEEFYKGKKILVMAADYFAEMPKP